MSPFALARPLVFAFDPERAHRMTIATLKLPPRWRLPSTDSALAVRLAGLTFPSPVGLAAGFDKDAEVPDAMLGLGFGFVEVGTLTPLPQPGNPKPRLFRLAEDEGVINRMGFNNKGQAAALARLSARRRRGIVSAISIELRHRYPRTPRYKRAARPVHDRSGQKIGLRHCGSRVDAAWR